MASRPLPLPGCASVRRASAGACLLALLLAGCGGGKTASPHGGTARLYGTVMRGPTSPVCRMGTPCSAPAKGTQLSFAQNGKVAARVVVARDGSYSVSLAPGTYSVAAVGQLMVRGDIEPSTVQVGDGPRQERDFQIDTGIR